MITRDYTEEEYKEMCAKLNQFKNTHSILDKDVLAAQMCDVLHINETLIIRFLKKAKIITDARNHAKTAYWVDEGPIYIGKVKEAVRLYKEYNKERNDKWLSKKVKPSIQECIDVLKENGYKVYKERVEWVEV